MSDFFSPSEVFGDKGFWRNFILSFLIIISAGYISVVAVTNNKVRVDKIGQVQVTSAPTTSRDTIEPISQIISASKTNKPEEYVGWVVNLNDLCKAGDYSEKPSVILIQNEKGAVTAATTKLSQEACDIIRKVGGEKSETNKLFAAYDDMPFKGVDAARIYVKLQTAPIGQK